MEPPRPATAASAEQLLELFQAIRRELSLREEAPSGEWVERSAEEARAGSRPAWFYPPEDGGGGIGVFNHRGPRGWAHVHVGAGPNAAERARLLGRALLDGVPPPVNSVSLGFTGFDLAEERAVAHLLADRPGARVVERFQMVRPLAPRDAANVPPLPSGVRMIPVRDATLEAVADLDLRAFRGSVDDLVMGGPLEEYAEMIRGLLASGMGRFLDEASTLLLQPEPLRLVGGVICSESTPRSALILDLVVEPERRNSGYGTFLVRWAFRALHGLGYSTATLWVTESNREALRLYAAEGFRRTASTIIVHWARAGGDPQPQASR